MIFFMIEKKEKLIGAYRNAIYAIDEPTYSLRWNRYNSAWDDFCKRHHIQHYAIVSPYNPGSIILSKEENELRFNELVKWADSEGWRYYYSRGIDPDGEWPDERGLLIVNAQSDELKSIAEKYGQNAFAQAKTGECLKLCWLI